MSSGLKLRFYSQGLEASKPEGRLEVDAGASPGNVAGAPRKSAQTTHKKASVVT